MDLIDGQLVQSKGQVSIVRNELGDHLFEGGKLWTVSCEQSWYEKWLIPFASGSVLEIGLGLGISSGLLLRVPGVTHVTTIERNADIINIFTNNTNPHPHHTIVHADVFKDQIPSTYAPYNTVFVDIWTGITKDEVDEFEFIRKKVLPLAPKATFIPWFEDYQELWHTCTGPDEFKSHLF